MYTIIITLIITLIISYYVAFKYLDVNNKISSHLTILAVVLVIGSFIGIISAKIVFITCKNDYILKEYSKHKIKCLDVKNALNSNLFLGTGHIGNNTYYYYYQHNERGGYTYKKIEANDYVIIYEDQDSTAYYTINKRTFPENHPAYKYSFNTKIVYEFHIPKNSIDNTFNLNLK